jgi:hypothetical protein
LETIDKRLEPFELLEPLELSRQKTFRSNTKAGRQSAAAEVPTQEVYRDLNF